MDTTFDRFVDEWTHVWQQIMDKLIELKEWQQMQEEVIQRIHTNRQMKPINEEDVDSDPVVDNNSHIKQLLQPIDKQMKTCFSDESVEDVRADDNDFNISQTSDNISFNQSFAEDSVVVPGIDGKNVKTFEQLLDLRLNGQKTDESVETIQNKPKKPFLRKGEGVKRFAPKNSGKKRTTITKVLPESDNKLLEIKTFVRKVDTNVLNKVNTNRHQFRKCNKNEEKPQMKKPVNKPVMPLTTKLDKNHKSVVITRNAPTVIQDLDDSDEVLFDCLQKIYENISIDDNSIDEQLKDKDINELQDLLKKIELKKKNLKQSCSDSNGFIGANDRQVTAEYTRHLPVKKEVKKRVHWRSQDIEEIDSEEQSSDSCELSEPKCGAYSSALKHQINDLEERLTRLKNSSKEKISDKILTKPQSVDSDILSPISNELKKLTEQIEKLNKKMISIESKSFDLFSGQKHEKTNLKQNVKVFPIRSEKTLTTNGHNISVNERQTDTTINFPNGDKMTVSKDNTIFYTFANGATQTTYPDGLKIIDFPNGQSEKIHKNGVKHITYANGLQRIINPDSSEEVRMTDGTVWRIHSDGSEVLEFANGDREIRTDKFKRREYSNGNMKTIYSDGTEETRYVCGRLRIKDRFGNLMVDSMVRHLNQHI
ncbi:centromere protein J-like [Oppia nitens]|uniref:centromere protein J-like n=1 Tax=Oppia nitens TaxID=1686743 RepID=UPI0023DB474C|nr:centromere protein J-like [Oppia nitens]